MKIQIYSIMQQARRGNFERDEISSIDMVSAKNLIDHYLLRKGYRLGVITTKVKPQGFGHGFAYTHYAFSGQHTLIDTLNYFNPKNDSGVLAVCFAITQNQLEAIVSQITGILELPEKAWIHRNFGIIEVSDEFPRNPDRFCVKDIIEKIEGRPINKMHEVPASESSESNQ